MGIITEIEAQQKGICCFCEQPIGSLTRLELENYRRTALCPKDYLTAISNKKKKHERVPVQVPLPIIDNAPTAIKLPPLAFGQLVLYRSDLLVDCVVQVEQMSANDYCNFKVICPGTEASNRIARYLGSK